MQIQQNPDFALGWAPEAIWDSLWAALGRSWDALGALLGAFGAPRPLKITLPCRRERNLKKITLSLLDGLSAPSGIHFGLLWDALGTLLGLFWALLGRAGPLLERSWSALGAPWWPLGCSLGALEAHLGPPEASGTPRGSIFRGFWVDLGVDLGGFGDRIR